MRPDAADAIETDRIRPEGLFKQALRLLLLLLCGCAALAASDSIGWSYRPLVSYDDESLVATWPVGEQQEWRIVDGAGQPISADIQIRDGAMMVRFAAHGVERIQTVHRDGHGPGLRLVRPGAASGLTADADGLPQLDGVPAVLVLDRIEARADRRWLLLREEIDARPVPCARLLAPPTVTAGQPVLIAQCIASQGLDPSGGVLVELSGLDRQAAWQHREYRQVLAWLVCDLHVRQAGHVALAQPVAAALHHEDLRPLQAQVRDVALAYRCRILETAALSATAYWQDGSGMLGTQLNEAGQAQRASLMAPWLLASR